MVLHEGSAPAFLRTRRGPVTWPVTRPEASDRPAAELPEQYLVLITCRDEKQQTELLARFQAEGLECRALLS
jgi:hypothetical protein